jgi:putative flippase GtrA
MTQVSPARPPRTWLVSRKVAPVRGWYRRWRTLIGEAWRFGIVGAANVVINFVVFNALALTLFPGGELKANIVATAFATTTSYLMNRGWTFRHRKTSRIPREYVLFFAFNAAALGIELGVMGAAKYGLGLTTLWALNLAKAGGLGLGTVFRFWTYRSFVFAGEPANPKPAQPVKQPMPAAPVRLSRTEPAEAFATARR